MVVYLTLFSIIIILDIKERKMTPVTTVLFVLAIVVALLGFWWLRTTKTQRVLTMYWLIALLVARTAFQLGNRHAFPIVIALAASGFLLKKLFWGSWF